MNYISSFFVAAVEDEKKRVLTKEQAAFVKQLKSSNGVFSILTESDTEEILCFGLNDLEFSTVVKAGGKQEKRC